MIEGLTIIENYITEEQESELLSKIRLSGIAMKKAERNSIVRYGSRVPYNSSVMSNSIPLHFHQLCERLLLDKLHDNLPDSVTVNEYRKGQGITYHYDSEKSGPVITVISLLGDATMGMARGTEEQFFKIPRRTLVTMKGEARSKWKHSILPVEDDRLSIVFRKGTI